MADKGPTSEEILQAIARARAAQADPARGVDATPNGGILPGISQDALDKAAECGAAARQAQTENLLDIIGGSAVSPSAAGADTEKPEHCR